VLLFGVTIPVTVPQRLEILDGLMNYLVLVSEIWLILTIPFFCIVMLHHWMIRFHFYKEMYLLPFFMFMTYHPGSDYLMMHCDVPKEQSPVTLL
jgi:hypothetical protein